MTLKGPITQERLRTPDDFKGYQVLELCRMDILTDVFENSDRQLPPNSSLFQVQVVAQSRVEVGQNLMSFKP